MARITMIASRGVGDVGEIAVQASWFHEMMVIFRRADVIRLGAVFLAASLVMAEAAQSPAFADPAAARDRTPDDLYRRRGYGGGGFVFRPGRGGLDMAGSCAALRFAKPSDCGRGYGIYGNGLGYGFGF